MSKGESGDPVSEPGWLIELDLGNGISHAEKFKGRAVPDRPLYGRRLRIALAMRGGVSLAVWIGGAVAELDILRRIRLRRDEDDPTTHRAYLIAVGEEFGDEVVNRATIYAAMLYRAGYDRVEFDVLAGASAGGFNAITYAAAQRAGAGLERLRTIWVKVGGFADLLQKPGLGALNAALRGDGYFYPSVRDALTEFYVGEKVIRNDLNRARRLVVELAESP